MVRQLLVVELGVEIRQDVGLEITWEDELAWAALNYASRSNRDFMDRFFDSLRDRSYSRVVVQELCHFLSPFRDRHLKYEPRVDANDLQSLTNHN